MYSARGESVVSPGRAGASEPHAGKRAVQPGAITRAEVPHEVEVARRGRAVGLISWGFSWAEWTGRQLREHPLTAHVPIVVLSAHAYPEDEDRARAAGAAAFLRKPCSPIELAATLRRASSSCNRKFESEDERPAAAV